MILSDFIPSIAWLRQYQREWLRPDLTAGLTAAAVVIPKAMAYATIAGLPVQVGLYTALVPMVVYALLGSSPPLSFSTTTTIAILAAAELGGVVPDGNPGALIAAGATLAVLTGVLLIVASVLRLGFIANFISEPVLTGFKSGIGLVIVVDQIPKLLGIHVEKAGFFRDLFAIAGQLPHASLITVAIGGSLLVMIFALERFAAHSPAPLIAVAVAIVASAIFGLGDAGVATVGSIPGGLPNFVRPHFGLIEEMWPATAGIALMSFTETIAAARARTQMARLITAAAAAATLLLFAPVIAPMPLAALAAVVVAYSFDLIKPAEFEAIRRVRRTEFGWALTAFADLVLLGTLRGILVAVIASLVSLAHQAYNPPVYAMGRKRGTQQFRPISNDHMDDETWAGLVILRVEGRLFFANVQRVADKMLPLIEQARPSVVALDCSAVIDIEYTAIKMLIEAEMKMSDQGIALWLVALNPNTLDVVRRSQLGETLGRERIVSNLETAVQQFQQPESPDRRPA